MQWPTCVHSDDTSGHEPGWLYMFELIQNTYRHLALKYSIQSYMQWPTCVHSDDASGHEPGWYHHRLVICVNLNT